MDAKLNRRKKASVRAKAQIIISIQSIDQRGTLYFQKKPKSLYIITVKIGFTFYNRKGLKQGFYSLKKGKWPLLQRHNTIFWRIFVSLK